MLLDLYHRLPYLVKVAAASGRGLYLRTWRYGRSTEALVREASERERWSGSDWASWLQPRLEATLRDAAGHVPHYRELSRGIESDLTSLTSWPVLTKESVRQAPERFISQEVRRWQRFPEHSSGTSGSPLTVWCSREALLRWYALLEARCRRWHGVDIRDRWAILGGQLVASVARDRPPFWVWNAPMRQLYLSSYHLKADNVGSYADAIEEHGISYLWGYASALSALAQMLVEQRRTVRGIRVALSNAEPLLDHQRELIGEAFGCPVRDTYGMAEMVAGASECDQGRMHLWPEVGLVEVLQLDSDEPAAPGEVGRLVCTGLLNDAMPLIRYEVGDLGALSSPGDSCPCGRTLPVVARIEGRHDDVVVTTDGRLVGRLDPVFKADLPVREAQIIQEEIGRFRVLISPSDDWRDDDGEVIARRLQDRVGTATVAIELVSHIPRDAAGKLKAVVSHVPPAQRVGRPGGPSS